MPRVLSVLLAEQSFAYDSPNRGNRSTITFCLSSILAVPLRVKFLLECYWALPIIEMSSKSFDVVLCCILCWVLAVLLQWDLASLVVACPHVNSILLPVWNNLENPRCHTAQVDIKGDFKIHFRKPSRWAALKWSYRWIQMKPLYHMLSMHFDESHFPSRGKGKREVSGA